MKATEEEILRGNKLIAGFMGFIPDTFTAGRYIVPKEFHHIYGKTWDINLFSKFIGWLIPVVDKIEKLKSEDGQELYYFIMISDTVTFASQITYDELIYVNWGSSKKESLWFAIVEFIEKYEKGEL